MTNGLVLGIGLTAVALTLSPWLLGDEGERQRVPHTPIIPAAPAQTVTASAQSEALHAPWLDDRAVAAEPPSSDSYCLTCHANPSLQTLFANGDTLPLHVDARELRDSAHGLMTCVTCHDDREVCPPDRAEPLEFAAYRAEATEMCIRCHLAAAGDYAQSVHGQPVLRDGGEGATCSDCHSLALTGHTVGWMSDPRLQLGAESVDESCGRCHIRELNSYRQTSHSKVARFGDPQRPANCTTCHGEHGVKAVDDPEASLTAANLLTVCKDCHDGADEAFASGWTGHAPASSRSAGLYYAERSVVLLIAVGLAFGLLHMTLDLGPRLAERWRQPGNRR